MTHVRYYYLSFPPCKVILTQATHLYFDHPYEPDPEERGYYWAPRFIDTRKTFGFIPDDVYANADFTRMGEPIVNLCEEMYKGKCVPLKEPQNIAGSLLCFAIAIVQLFRKKIHTDYGIMPM